MEMMSNPMWRWWLRRTDQMVRRMNAGFHSFGVADIAAEQEHRGLHLPGGDVEAGWNYLIWLLAGTITDIVEGISPPEAEQTMAEAILRLLGVPETHAAAVAHELLRPYRSIPVDFYFVSKARPEGVDVSA
jgi:hypothetical protein